MGPWSITFTNTALLATGLALFVPYLVHLLTRRTPRRLVFPTVRFIRKAEASHSALFRLRDILLLLVRTAFVALLVLTFLKPVLRAQASKGADSGRRTAIVILDRSLSMGYTGTGFTPFARGQLAAGKVIESLESADAANLILAGAAPAASFTAPAANKYHLLRDLREARASLERADWDAAIAEAVRQLDAEPRHGRGTIYVVSDFQRTNWAAVNFSAIPQDVNTVFVPVAEERPWNLAVIEVGIEPASPVVSEDIEIVCKVANYGGVAETAPVTLDLRDISSGEATALQREVNLQAGAAASVSFRMRPLKRGHFEGTVRIRPDGLAADDTRHFAIQISDRIEVALLTDKRYGPGETDDAYLLHAIDPSGGTAGGESPRAAGSFHVNVMTSERFGSAPPPGTQLVVIQHVNSLGETAAKALARYIEHGGSAIYFLAGPADGANLSALETASERNLQLPFSVASDVDYRTNPETTYVTFAEANFDDPMLRRFRENGDIGAAHFYRLFATERIGGQGQILIRYNDGNIALARSTYGAGSLLLCNFDLSRNGSDLTRKTVFVPFIHELLKAMRPHDSAGRVHTVGFPALTSALLAPEAAGVRFTNPDLETVTASVEHAGDVLTVAFPDTPVPGFYRVYEGSRQAAAAAVNVDPRESDLSVLTEAQMESLIRDSRRQFTAVDGADPDFVRRFLEGVPLWPYLLLAALAMLGFEQLLLVALRR